LRQASHMLRLLPGERVGVIAHSLSAVIALRLAGIERRVSKVLTTGAMGGTFRLNRYLDWVWSYPADRQELRRTAQGLVFDKSLITEAFLDSRMEVCRHKVTGNTFAQCSKATSSIISIARLCRQTSCADSIATSS
jgi:2-hydroxymuconate-semialdehyde hydrolase